jgi:hypothetical protein
MIFFAAETPAQGFDKLSLIGVTLNYNQRTGTYDFRGNHLEEIGKPDLLTSGFVLGKRWRLLPSLRLQLSANINYGSVVDDSLPARYFTSGDVSVFTGTIIHTTFLYGGADADFQVPVAGSPGSLLFLHAGGGGHVVSMDESERTLDSPPAIVQGDNYTVSQLSLSTSLRGGLGFEIILSPRYGFCLDYSLRYWYPVHFEMSRDLFPYNPVHYHERFFSHELNVSLLVKRR